MFSHLMSVCTQFQQALAVVFLAAHDQRNSVKLLEDHIHLLILRSRLHTLFWREPVQCLLGLTC